MDGNCFLVVLIVLLRLTNVLPDASHCQNINGNCYWLSTNTFNNDHDAQTACEKGDGILADLGKSQGNDTWSKLKMFFGTNVRNVEGIWLGYHDNPWYDMFGNKLDVSHWKPDSPSNHKCVVSHLNDKGLLEDEDCRKGYEGLCVKHNLDKEQCDFNANNNHYVNNTCYFLTNSQMSYVAEVECRIYNGTLVNLTDAYQWEELSTGVGFQKLSTGLGTDVTIWTGITTDPRIWLSYDGDLISWSNWIPDSEPSDSHHCVMIDEEYNWKVVDCNQHHQGLCRCRKSSTDQSVEYECSSTRTTGCFTERSGKYCYWLEQSKDNAHVLQQLCRETHNGQLAIISGEKINQQLKNYFRENDICIGVTNKPRLWYTNEGNVVRNANIIWDDDEPSSDKHCAVIKVGSGFKVSECEDKTLYFGLCERTGSNAIKRYWKTGNTYRRKDDAESDCKEGGGRLFIPPQGYNHNDQITVNEIYKSLLSEDIVDWRSKDTEYWTGITDKVRFWYNRRNSDRFNLVTDKPADENCVIMTLQDEFQWSTTKCLKNSNSYPALCMKYSNEMSESTISSTKGSTPTHSTSAEIDTTTQTIKSTTQQTYSPKPTESTIEQTNKTTTESTTNLADATTPAQTSGTIEQENTETKSPTENTTKDGSTVSQSTPESTTEYASTVSQSTQESTTKDASTVSQSTQESTTEYASTVSQPTPESTTEYASTVSQSTPESTTKDASTVSQSTQESTTKDVSTVSQSTQESTTEYASTVSQPTPESTTEYASTVSQPTPESTTEYASTVSQSTPEITTKYASTQITTKVTNSTTSGQSTESPVAPSDTTTQLSTESSVTQANTTTQTSTESAVTQANTTNQPSTESSVAQANTTTQPSTESSVTQANTTTQPSTESAVTQANTTNQPSTESSVAHANTTTQPSTESGVTQANTTTQPSTESSVAQANTTTQPSTESSVAQADTTTQPSTESSITEQNNRTTEQTDTTPKPTTESTHDNVNTTQTPTENEQTNTVTQPLDPLGVTTKANPTTKKLKPVKNEQKFLKLCSCPCLKKKNSVQNKTQLKVKVKEIKKHLTVSKNNLSSTIRKRKSSTDSRSSSRNIGCITIVLLSIVSAAIIIPDVFKIVGILFRKFRSSEEDEMDME